MTGRGNDEPSGTPSLDGVWHAEALPAALRSTVGAGLSGAVAGGTRVAWLDPQTGEVGYHGHALASLRGMEPDALAYLLLTGTRPDAADATDSAWAAARQVMVEAARLPGEVIEWFALTESRDDPLKVLRAGLSLVGCADEEAGSRAESPLPLHAAMRLLGHVAGLVKLRSRRQLGHPLQREWEANMGLGERLLTESRMLPPTRQEVSLFNDTVLALADGALTAGAFAGLVVASCEADWHAAVVAALSGFEGELQWPSAKRESAPDARRDLLREVLHELEAMNGPASARDDAAGQGATLTELGCEALRRLQVAEPLIGCVYVFARSLGLVSRLYEQSSDNRIYRPLAGYTGPAPRSVAPLAQR